jgi:hypothetical protein
MSRKCTWFTIAALTAAPIAAFAAECPTPLPDAPTSEQIRACLSEIPTLQSQIKALSDALVGAPKPTTGIQVDGGALSAANCPEGYYLSGVKGPGPARRGRGASRECVLRTTPPPSFMGKYPSRLVSAARVSA